jgi:predicted naringenin-chalcone synthase
MSLFIAGIGTAVPRHRIDQADAAELARRYSCTTAAQERLTLTLYRWSGVETRHGVILNASEGDLDSRQSFYNTTAPQTRARMQQYEAAAGSLALAAARAALVDAAIAPGRVTHLVTVSCSGFYAPGFDIALCKQLPLRSDVSRTHIGFMGCQAALNGLRVARAFLDADPSACVLVCALELCSLHHRYAADADQIVANSLFADGAAALVGVARDATRSAPYRLIAAGSTLVENTEDAMSWRIGDHGFEMTLSQHVPELIAQNLRPWLDHWLAQHSLNIASVGSWAVHPGGPRILSAVGEAAGLDRAALATSYQVLASHGNMSSPTVLFILDQLRRDAAPSPCVALAFGPGLTVEAAIFA